MSICDVINQWSSEVNFRLELTTKITAAFSIPFLGIHAEKGSAYSRKWIAFRHLVNFSLATSHRTVEPGTQSSLTLNWSSFQ